MTIEKLVLGVGGALLASSATGAAVRRRTMRRARAAERVGNRLLRTVDGVVEYRYVRAADPTGRTIVFENGSGAPLEGWDWLVLALSGRFDIMLYHRRGYGATTLPCDTGTTLRLILENCGDTSSSIIYVGHSLGGLVARCALAESSWLRARVSGLVLIDTTDPEMLAEVGNSPVLFGKLSQSLLVEYVGAIVGTSSVVNPFLRDVDYRAEAGQAYGAFSIDPRTIRTAARELRRLVGRTSSIDTEYSCPVHVISAEIGADGTGAHHVEQQRMAERIGAEFSVVPGAGHRSIIGRQEYARTVSEHILGGTVWT